MKYSELINEGRSEEIDKKFDEILSLLEKNCSNALNEYRKNGFVIWRGLSYDAEHRFKFFDGKNSVRQSANTSNYFTNIIGQLPEWKKWPKRHKSLIGSTDESGAEGYGKRFMIFPYDNVKIGIAGTNDFWEAFNTDLFGDLPSFNYTINEIQNYYNKANKNIDLENSSNVKQDLNILNKYIFKLKNKDTEIYSEIREFFDLMSETNTNNLYDAIAKYLNPNLNPNMSLVNSVSMIRKTESKWKDSLEPSEVWLEGPAIMISKTEEDKFQQIN